VRNADQDKAKARQLLKDLRIEAELPLMSDLARSCAFRLRDSDRYEWAGEAFCDGIGVDLYNVSKGAAIAHQVGLRNAIHNVIDEWNIRHILITARRNSCYLWITLDPECAQLDGMMVTKIRKMELALTQYAQRLLAEPDGEPANASISKIDLARDSSGSFLPDTTNAQRGRILAATRLVVAECFQEREYAFLAPRGDHQAIVKLGSNNLDTCYQFDICGESRRKAATIKMYDKIQDLVARDGSGLVGSRCDLMLGAKRSVNAFQKKIRSCQHRGMMRIELSIFIDRKFCVRFANPHVARNLPTSIKNLIWKIRGFVLNVDPVRSMVLKRVSIECLMAEMGAIQTNYLIVGDQLAWLVVASNWHRNFYVGTERNLGLKSSPGRERSWQDLEVLVKRYASPGATVKVFYLHSTGNVIKPVARITKSATSHF